MKKVVLIGDSIRLYGYGLILKNYLPNDVEIYQSTDNARFSKYTLRMLFDERANIEGADVIHWNNGEWDICKLFGDNEPFTPLNEYLENMGKIADILLKYGKKVIFSTTTPVRKENLYNENKVIEQYNKAVVKMLKKKGVIINDLYSVIVKDIDKYIKGDDDNIHLTAEGSIVAAESVAKIIKDNL